MGIEHILVVVPVSDIDVARDWYARLLGGEPTNTPMESLVEWRVTGTGWLQITRDAGRAPASMRSPSWSSSAPGSRAPAATTASACGLRDWGASRW